MRIEPIKTDIFKESSELSAFIFRFVPRLNESSILVITSKIVALSQGQTRPHSTQKEFDSLVRRYSKKVWNTPKAKLTFHAHGFAANAGIDLSNGNGKYILPPRDTEVVAESLLRKLKKHYNVEKLGLIITDSMPLPLKRGVVGVSLASAGFSPTKSYDGKKDLFGRPFQYTAVNVADSLAAAACVLMGEGAESQPLAVITEAPVVFAKKASKTKKIMRASEDIFGPLYRS